MATTPADIATTYFDGWERQDFTALASLLTDDVTFDGPLASIRGREECLDGLLGLARATTGLTVIRRLHDENDVMTWFELTVGEAEPTPVVNWCHVEHGQVTSIKVTFDPRGMLAAG